jgi:LysR family hydrogen peroxide-inducible transcriptional activator
MYVSRDNEFYGRKSIRVDEVDVRKLLLMAKVHCLRNQGLPWCQKRKKIDLQYDFVSSSLETLAHTADEIGGMTIIPAMSIGYIPEEKRDQIVPIDSERASRKITMAVGRTFMRESVVDAVKKSIMEAQQELKIAEFLI